MICPWIRNIKAWLIANDYPIGVADMFIINRLYEEEFQSIKNWWNDTPKQVRKYAAMLARKKYEEEYANSINYSD